MPPSPWSPSVHLVAVCPGSGYTGMGISLYSSTPSRSSNTGSASLASSCGGGEGRCQVRNGAWRVRPEQQIGWG